MILGSLIDYYDRISKDPECDIAAYGYSRQKVSFCVTLDLNGQLVQIADARQTVERANGKMRAIPRRMLVLGQSKPTGSGINPCLLWDNSSYMLGFASGDGDRERALQCFAAFKDKHLALESEIDDEAFSAVCRFLEHWEPKSFEPSDAEQEALASFGVFRIDGTRSYVHERERVRAWYEQQTQDEWESMSKASTPSLTNGQPSRIARLHEPKIKGVRGAQSSGATLVSFNIDAAESYGKSQGENAPVSVRDAFKYCTALNYLLARPGRTSRVGDMSIVWWTDSAEHSDAAEVVSSFFADHDFEETEYTAAEDAANVKRLQRFIGDLSRGTAPRLDGTEHGFNLLGLSPNAARIAVRLWWQGPLRDMLDRLAQHHADAALEPAPTWETGRPLTIQRMVRETARHLTSKPDYDTISPTLAGEVARAVLTGGVYPLSLLQTLIRRVRTDGRVTHTRTAIVKACITRRRRILAGPDGQYEEVPVSLNPDGSPPYQLGRLFAVLEKTQDDAQPGIDATIRDRYFGSASSTPASVFPRLIRLTQHHLSKLDPKLSNYIEKQIQAICQGIDRFPHHLNLEAQGLFQLGYYHQTQDLYTKKTREAEPAIAEEN